MVSSVWRRYVSYENKTVEHPRKTSVPKSEAGDLEMEELKPGDVKHPVKVDAAGGDQKSPDEEAVASVPAPQHQQDPLHIA